MEENRLLEDCLAGNKHAQKLLYETYARKMFGVCVRYAPDRSMAEDFLQEGFIKVFENLKKFESKGSFEGWIRRIMVNTALEMLRKKNVLRNTVEIDNTHEPPSDEGPEEGFEQVSMEALTMVMAEMPPGFKTVFNLYAVEDYSHKEIAQMMDISEGTSKSQYARARAWLQKRLNEKNLIKNVGKQG